MVKELQLDITPSLQGVRWAGKLLFVSAAYANNIEYQMVLVPNVTLDCGFASGRNQATLSK
jgi:hypothetical protein